MRLMTNNPAKYGGLEGYGLDIVERVPLEPTPNPENVEYLRTKRERLGHLLEPRWRTQLDLATSEPTSAEEVDDDPGDLDGVG